LISGLDGVSGQLHALTDLPPPREDACYIRFKKRPGTRGVLDVVENRQNSWPNRKSKLGRPIVLAIAKSLLQLNIFGYRVFRYVQIPFKTGFTVTKHATV